MEEVSAVSGPSFQELLAAELRLDPRQWEEAPMRRENRPTTSSSATPVTSTVTQRREGLLEIDCLVHEDWMLGASTGILPPPRLPSLPAEEVHWLLQPSCDYPAPKHWQRVSVLCIRKASGSDTTTKSARRFLIRQERGYSKDSIHELLTQISQENLLGSWQEVLQSMHPTLSTGPRHLTPSYIREVVHKLYHLEVVALKSGGQRRRQSGQNPSSAAPLSGKTRTEAENNRGLTTSKPGERVHANLAPLLAAMESRRAFYLVFPYMRFTLFDIALHSPAMFNDSLSKPLFVLYQLLKVLEHCHRCGITLAPLSLRNVFVDSRLWVQVRMPADILCLVRREVQEMKDTLHADDRPRGVEELGKGMEKGKGESKSRRRDRERMREKREKSLLRDAKSVSASTITASDLDEGELTESAKDTSSESSPVEQPNQTLTDVDVRLCSTVSHPPAMPLSEAVKQWQHGKLDNFTYLMLLNHHAGRRLGDPNNHPIFPWVSDFSHPTRSFHDLTKSKYRLNKGDDQLNFAYTSAKEEARRGGLDQEPPIAHHVDDVLTDVTYYVYKARRTPREVLCTHVRPRWVPEEYPVSMEKLYLWTPDESIPEFYTDPEIFKSIHSDLPDLALPTWCPSPEAFIKFHRHTLEGDYVSSQLHHWIDLTFGYKLSGEAAVRAKNVYVSLVDKHKNPKNHGIVQLFKTSHPKRASMRSASVAFMEWETYLGQSSVSDGASFPIDRCEMVSLVTGAQASRLRNRTITERDDKVEMKILENIFEQNLRGDGVGGGELRDGKSANLEEVHEEKSDDSSFEQIPFPDESYASSTPSSHPNPVGITYGESSLDFYQNPALTSSSQIRPPQKIKEGAVLNAPQTVTAAQQNRFVKYFRQRKGQNQSDGSGEEYPWQNMEISFPKDSHILHGLTELEERAHFVAKCCKDFGDTLGSTWDQGDIEVVCKRDSSSSPPLVTLLQRLDSDPTFFPSLEERVMIDVASAMATVIEMCCMRELRVATRTNASLLERVMVIRSTLHHGQLRLPSYLQSLAELVLVPDRKKTVSSHFVLPHLSPSLLLQPFIPVVSFPIYFEQLYRFASTLELYCREAGLKKYHESQQLVIKPLSPPSSLHPEFNPSVLDKVGEHVIENLKSLLREAQGEGFVLLLLHLYPLFQYPETSFDMIQTHLDTLGQFMSHVQMYRLFGSVLMHFFDNCLEPHQQGYLLSRLMADFIIRRFGLHAFLSKFLEFYLEAVLEFDRLSSKGPSFHGSIHQMKESESILNILPSASEIVQSLQYDEHRKHSHMSDFTFSVDLSEMGGYNSDREYSSGESDGEFPPEASLLARTGMVLEDIDEESQSGESSRDKRYGSEREGQQGSVRMMLLPQLSLSSGREMMEAGMTHEKSQRIHRSTSEGVAGAGEGADGIEEVGSVDREDSVSHPTSTTIGTTSSNFRASTDSPTDITVSTLNGGIEDSILSFNIESHSSPLTKNTSQEYQTQESSDIPTWTAKEQGSSGSLGGIRGETSMVGGSRQREDSKVGEQKMVDENELEEGAVVEEEENMDSKKTTETSRDPEQEAINQRISEVAGDCLTWLLRRLGPLLATQHVINPLLNGIHRCFTGILDHNRRSSVVLKCLTSMAEIYGESILLKLYLPRVEGWVVSATNRMSVKAESNVAASLAVMRVVIRQLSSQQLEDVTSELCETFFIPLIQLLSSQTVFPSGGEARATICHSLVLLLLKTGERLGREKSLLLLLETLRLFFTCFDGVYKCMVDECQQQGRSRAESSLVPASNHYSTQTSAPENIQASDVERARAFSSGSPLTSRQGRGKLNPKKKAVSLETENGKGKSFVLASVPVAAPNLPLEQLQATFTPAMAHATYIPFCLLLGQIKLNMELRNTELIEQIAYNYDDNVKEKSSLPSVFLNSEEELSSESGSESEHSTSEEHAEDDLMRDVTIKLGPVVALQKKSGLDEDAVNFGRSSWFVDLQQEGGNTLNDSASIGVFLPSNIGVTSGVEWGNESVTVPGSGVTSGVSVGVSSSSGVGSTEVSRTSGVSGVLGDEGVGGKGVRGSAMATATGFFQLIQNRPATEIPRGSGSKADDYLTRHSLNFDMKFHPSPPSTITASSSQQTTTQSSFDGSTSEDIDCHLSGHWKELWESQIHRLPHSQEPYTQFLGKKLQTYSGHRGSVRSLATSNTEHFFISASKDKTLKLWLLRNQGSGSAHISAHLTYSQHQKAVSHVELVSATGNALSCDGTVHLWDTEFGHPIHQFSSPRGREFIAMTCLLPPQPVAVVATNDLNLGFIDFRSHTLQHTWKLHFSTGGILRSVACGDNWVAVGNNNGTINTLDMRMGAVLHHWRPNDYALTQTTTWNENLFQMCSTRHGNLVTSVGPGIMHLWRPSTGKLLSHIRGQSSTTPCLDSMGEQLVSASSNGHVVIHNSFEHTRDPASTQFWSTKVRTRELKGGVASMATLQEKRLLLLGSDNGQIVLMS